MEGHSYFGGNGRPPPFRRSERPQLHGSHGSIIELRTGRLSDLHAAHMTAGIHGHDEDDFGMGARGKFGRRVDSFVVMHHQGRRHHVRFLPKSRLRVGQEQAEAQPEAQATQDPGRPGRRQPDKGGQGAASSPATTNHGGRD
jgi:hypothetical protein